LSSSGIFFAEENATLLHTCLRFMAVYKWDIEDILGRTRLGV
jgi:hypothetical protein